MSLLVLHCGTRFDNHIAVHVQAYGIPYRGGKPDDITVLVSYVSKTEGESPAAAGSNGADAADAPEQLQSKL